MEFGEDRGTVSLATSIVPIGGLEILLNREESPTAPQWNLLVNLTAIPLIVKAISLIVSIGFFTIAILK